MQFFSTDVRMDRKFVNSIISRLIPVSSKIIGAPRNRCEIKTCIAREVNTRYHAIETLNYNIPARHIPSIFDGIQESLSSFFVAELANARVWGANGAVIDNKDYFIEDVSREFNKGLGIDHSVFYCLKQVRCKKINGKVAVIGTAGANIYYHWMMDILPRIGLLGEYTSIDDIDYFITGYTGNKFQEETIMAAGISPEKILSSNNNKEFHIEAKMLFVPSFAGILDKPSLYQVNFLRRIFNRFISTKKSFRHIYISRKNSSTRNIVNEKEVLEYLLAMNVEIVYCENISVANQVKIFSEAKMIIGPHGSGFTNLVFCQPGTFVIDIFNTAYRNPCFYYLANVASLNYNFICGTPVPIDDNCKNDNSFLDMNEFAGVISRYKNDL